jgi:hypothetical protein
VHVIAAGVGGLGLAGVTLLVRSDRKWHRLAVAAALGIILGLVLSISFPKCLADPYAALDPRIISLWLHHVAEAQTFFSTAHDRPQLVLPMYGIVVISAVLYLILALRIQETVCWPWLLVVGTLTALFAVELWEVRAAAMAGLIAIPLICGSLVRLFPSNGKGLLGPSNLALGAALLLNQITLAKISEAAVRGLETFTNTLPVSFVGAEAACLRADDFAPLSTLPRGLVLAFIDNGPIILQTTNHSVLAAPYHRNVSGNSKMLDIFLASPVEAKKYLKDYKVDYIAFCPSAAERYVYTTAAPNGFAALLAEGKTPNFLTPLSMPKTSVSVYRVQQ